MDTDVLLALIVHTNDLVNASCTSRVEMIVEFKAPPKLQEHNELGAISNTILEAYALCICTIHTTTSMRYWIHMSSNIYLSLYQTELGMMIQGWHFQWKQIQGILVTDIKLYFTSSLWFDQGWRVPHSHQPTLGFIPLDHSNHRLYSTKVNHFWFFEALGGWRCDSRTYYLGGGCGLALGYLAWKPLS